MAVEDTPTVEPKDGIRDNAILFRGEPISKLPTARIFKYVSLSATAPLGLEWVDDTNVVLVWKNAAEARSAFHSMREAGTLEMEEDDEGFLPARPMPETLAPMEMRLEKALGKAIQEQGQMWMRWAQPEDVKVKGGKSKSKFYERYGENAGKEGQNVFASRTTVKRKRRDYDEEGDDRDDLRKRLDAGESNGHFQVFKSTVKLTF
jgi:Nuclear cap-binding protein subunit 3